MKDSMFPAVILTTMLLTGVVALVCTLLVVRENARLLRRSIDIHCTQKEVRPDLPKEVGRDWIERGLERGFLTYRRSNPVSTSIGHSGTSIEEQKKP